MKKNKPERIENPEENIFESVLDEVVRKGAQRMLETALNLEIEEFCRSHAQRRDEEGRRLVVRNGSSEARTIVTGAGPLKVRTPRVDDRILEKAGEIRFKSSLVPPYLRRTKNIEELVPVLYLKGISTGDFTEALEKILGKDVAGFSAENIVRMKQIWETDYKQWIARDLSASRYVYWWCPEYLCK